MLMRIENEDGESYRRPFTSVAQAIEYLEDNLPCRKSGSILVVVSDAEIAFYNAMKDGRPAAGWHMLNDPAYKKETLIVVEGACE
jgi:hypothetical protein